MIKRKLLYDWFAGRSFDFVKKQNLVILGGPGQSNEGTDTTAGSQATGATPRSYMPTRLTTAPSNVKYGEAGGGGTYTVQDWSVSASLTWGWLNQLLYVVSPVWINIVYGKCAVGGTTLRLQSNGGGTYNRSLFYTRAGVILDYAIATYGLGNFNTVMPGGIGETNALSSQAVAEELEAALLEFYQEFYTTVLEPRNIPLSDVLIMHRKTGKWQVVDFQFVEYSRTSIENAIAATPKARIIKGSNINGGAKSDTLDNTPDNDNSHLNAAGSIMTGNNAATELLAAYGVTRVDSTKPVLQSAVINSGTPNQIVLTYDKTLDSAISLFWKDFAPVVAGTTTRKVVTIAISGTTVTLTLSENVYSGQAVTLSYTKAGYFENVICDVYGNEADEFTGIAVTNNSATSSPTVTNSYTSDFSAGVNSWGSATGASLAAVDGIQGQDDVLEITATGTTCTAFRSVTLVNGGTYRLRFKAYFPETLQVGGTTSNAIQSQVLHGTASLIANLYQYTRRVVLTGWVDYEFTFTAGATGQIRLGVANITIGQKFYAKDFVLDRLT